MGRTAMRRVLRYAFFARMAAATLVAVPALAAEAGAWWFLPVGGNGDVALARTFMTPAGRPGGENYRWRPVDRFPHRVSRQDILPEAHYWYAVSVPVEAAWRDRGLLLDWGVIDDADQTFVNGEPAGATGSFENKHLSAWNVDRLYWLPPGKLADRDEQAVAVLVKDWGGRGALGGFWGPPVVGIPLLRPEQRIWRRQGDVPPAEAFAPDPDDARWEFYFTGTGDQKGVVALQSIPPRRGPSGRRPADAGRYAWFRMTFDLPEEALDRDLFLDLGRINDVAACYVNGIWTGQAGRFPDEDPARPAPLLQTGDRLTCVVPAGRCAAEGNVLTLRVWTDEQSMGGWFGQPMIPVFEQRALRTHFPAGSRRDTPPADTSAALEGDASPSSTASTAGRPLSLLKAYLNGIPPGSTPVLPRPDDIPPNGEDREAGNTAATDVLSRWLEKELAAASPDDPDRRQRLLGLRVALLARTGRPDEAWQTFTQLDFQRPVPADAAFAAAELAPARGAAEKGVVYVGEDRNTQGDWPLRYGHDMAVLCAVNAPFDMVYGNRQILPYRLMIGTVGDEVARAWLGSPRNRQRRALFFPSTGERRYASWDDRGEAQPFDDDGPDLLLELSVPAGAARLSFYFMDWDWADGPHPRGQTLALLDEQYRPLSVVNTEKFHEGMYKTFLVEGPRKLRVRLNKHRSPCVVLSGLFVDRLRPLPTLANQADPEDRASAGNRIDNKSRSVNINDISGNNDNLLITTMTLISSERVDGLAHQAKERRDGSAMRFAAYALWLAGKTDESVGLIREMMAAPVIAGKTDDSPEAKTLRKARLERFIREGEKEAYPTAWVAEAARKLRKEWPDADVEALLRRKTSKWALMLPEQP